MLFRSNPNGGYQEWQTSGTGVMRLDSSGNLGLGVTPSAWITSSKAFQLNTRAALFGDTTLGTNLTDNLYLVAGPSFKYLTTAAGTVYLQSGGQHQWYNTPSGTAGTTATVTQAMTLDASGNLGVGTTSPSRRLSLDGGAATQTWTGYQQAGTEKFVVGLDASGNPSLYGTQSAPMIFYTNNTEQIGRAHV